MAARGYPTGALANLHWIHHHCLGSPYRSSLSMEGDRIRSRPEQGRQHVVQWPLEVKFTCVYALFRSRLRHKACLWGLQINYTSCFKNNHWDGSPIEKIFLYANHSTTSRFSGIMRSAFSSHFSKHLPLLSCFAWIRFHLAWRLFKGLRTTCQFTLQFFPFSYDTVLRCFGYLSVSSTDTCYPPPLLW